jgi:hypothetical protein
MIFNTFRMPRPSFRDVTGGDRRIVLEEDQVLALDRFADERSLERQRVHRIQVVAHDPWIGHVAWGSDPPNTATAASIQSARFGDAWCCRPPDATPGMIVASASTSCSTPASASGGSSRPGSWRGCAVRRSPLPIPAADDFPRAGKRGRTRPPASRIVKPLAWSKCRCVATMSIDSA